jgi:predicted PurR-regulated permease PerM
LVVAAAWGWRLLIVGAVVYFVVMFLARVPIISVPVFLALLLAALLHRPVILLRRLVPASVAAIGVLVAALILASAVGWLVYLRISSQAPVLATESQHVYGELQSFLARLPGVGTGSGDALDQVKSWVTAHSSSLLSGAQAAGTLLIKVVTGAVLTAFLTLFFLIDGDRQWRWVVRLLPRSARPVVNGAGHRAFAVLSGWIGGTVVIAVIHAVVIGLTAWLLGAPLAVVLAVLVFFGSFIPLVGAIVFGGIAVLVVLLAVGLWPAVILLAVLLVEAQLEAHVYQPLIMRRAVGLHPVAIIVALTSGGLLGGVFGALAAIPVAAAAAGVIKYATGIEDVQGRPLVDEDRMEPESPPIVVGGSPTESPPSPSATEEP